eukprot:4076147-Alexandrium_andersonii.AAC.1
MGLRRIARSSNFSNSGSSLLKQRRYFWSVPFKQLREGAPGARTHPSRASGADLEAVPWPA